MKNILLAFAVMVGFAACNSKKSETRDIRLLNDSSAYNNDMYSDTSNMTQAEPVAVPVTRTPRSVAPRTTTSGTHTHTKASSSTNSGSGTSTQTTQTTTRKKGWSSAAKGAVIGGGAGAVGGAIISRKKPVQGAIIGGVVGAAGGYIIGKDIDKKKGR